MWWKRETVLDEELVHGLVTAVMRIDAKLDEALESLRGEDEEELDS